MPITTSQPSHNRFARVGFNVGLKSHSEPRNRALKPGESENDDEWYIPYTGTYEPPPEVRPSRNKNRDSWGDPIMGPSAAEPPASGLHVHYGSHMSERRGLSEESRSRGRGRAQSISSNYTASSSLDHGRASQSAQRPCRNTSLHRKPTRSNVNLDTGGVGASPMPHLRQPKDRPLSHRGSLASIFTFGVKPPSSPLHSDTGIKSAPRQRSIRRSTSSGADRPGSRLSPTDHRRTTSGDSNSHSTRVKRGVTNPLQSVESSTITDEDYYNSYYSTLLQTPAKRRPVFPAAQPGASTSQHPYALADRTQIRATISQPNSAPPTSLTYQPALVPPKLTSSTSQPPAQPPGSGSALLTPSRPQKQIKGSVSTPNLKDAKNALGTSRNLPKGIDRWLSAETWCDAILFPRPRLKIKNEMARSGRIVSPPGSPVLLPGTGGAQETESVPSRVLAHTRSLGNLKEAREEEPRHGQYQGGGSLTLPPTASQVRLQPQALGEERIYTDDNQPSRPPRPKSWASDDLDLPTPVPSLAKVLVDGERLQSDRKMWQSRAAGSWGNQHARSLSRSRSKSLTAKGRKMAHQMQSSMDFLAARAVHGNQDVIPVLSPTLKHKRVPSSQQGTNSHSHSRNTSNTHTQTSSAIRTWSHSSKSPSRNHSRNESWSKSAIRAVKSTAPCLNDDATTTPTDEKNIEYNQNAALHKGDTQPPQTASIPAVPSSSSLPPPIGPSPTPSNASGSADPRVGIAISTPLTDEGLDRENLRLASHPYAQGGLYSYTAPALTRENRVGYAGPHPVQSLRPADIPDGPAARHKLPPHITLSHPYAQAHSPSADSYDDRLIRHVRLDSDVPPPAKMWAPLAPGVVREILPNELKYSPSIDSGGKLEGDMAMAVGMCGIVDTVGVGEALAYASEGREREEESARDSGLGTSENVHSFVSGSREVCAEVKEVNEQCATTRLGSPSRVPVQYDVTRRLQSQRMERTPETLHTLASSPLEHPFTPRMPEFIRTEMASLASPEINSSESSSQRNSPRPLGSPTDLAEFQDLFYKPGNTMNREPRKMASLGNMSWNGSPTQLSNIPFDLKSPIQQRTSGLTSLTRKFSQEYERLSNQGGSSSRYSQSNSSNATGSPRPPTTRRPTDTSLEFVFEQSVQGMYTHEHETTGSSAPFEPRENIPEDVQSMSSMETGKELEQTESEEETEIFHVKQVETATPAEVDADKRLSYAGQMGYQTDHHDVSTPQSVTAVLDSATPADQEGCNSDVDVSSPTSQARASSGLQPPLSGGTRSSFYTTSSMSRMSNLSDFPLPPASHRMSLISAYFNEAAGRPSTSKEDGPAEPLPSQSFNSNNRLTFGVGASVEEIAEALSHESDHF